jgi:hypothetical protein
LHNVSETAAKFILNLRVYLVKGREGGREGEGKEMVALG